MDGERSYKQQRHSSEQENQIVGQDIHRDRISDLPDSLLLHMLSLLTMEDVVRTSFLSRRWRYLWTSIPFLNFEASEEMASKRKEFAAFIDRTLVAYKGSKVQGFRVSYLFTDETHASQVDSWIFFALTHSVDSLELDFINGYPYPPYSFPATYTFYKLPHSLFDCGSITHLTLRFCNLDLPDSLCLSSLIFLSLETLELSNDAIKVLTSGSPDLECLCIKECNWRSNLNIFIVNPSVESLTIQECNDYNWNTVIEIYAPNLLYLEFITSVKRSRYHVKGRLSSHLIATICIYDDPKLYDENDGEAALVKFLNDLRQVQCLQLCSWTIQVLSIREVQNLPVLALNSIYLELKTGLTKWELPGIAYLLRSCPNLEILIVNTGRPPIMQFTDDFKNKYNFSAREYWRSQVLGFSSFLQKVKEIEICMEDCMRRPKEDIDTAIEELFKGRHNEIELVIFLLKSCKLLQRMTIVIPKNHPLSGKELELPSDFGIVSPDAKIIFS